MKNQELACSLSKKQRDYFANKGPSSQSYGFSSSHVHMWELDYKESWAVKNWCFWTVVVLEKTPESPWDCKEIKPVHPKGSQSWIFIGRTDAEAPMLWSPDAKSWLTGKEPDAGKDWGQEKKGTTEDEMVRWHHQLNGDEFESTPGVGDGQGGLACCGPWGHKNSDMAELLNWSQPNRASQDKRGDEQPNWPWHSVAKYYCPSHTNPQALLVNKTPCFPVEINTAGTATQNAPLEGIYFAGHWKH